MKGLANTSYRTLNRHCARWKKEVSTLFILAFISTMSVQRCVVVGFSNIFSRNLVISRTRRMYAKIASENDPFSLVIVESPAKAGTIAKYLNANSEHRYVVRASMGHVRDLPQSARQTNLLPAKFRDSKWATLGIDLDSSTFDPMYITLPDKIKHVRELQDLSKSAEEVILATDEDREGEAISWHLSQLLKLKNSKRVTFTEITAEHVTQQMLKPRSLDMNLVNAQECRRILDRLAGYQMSPALWKKIASGLSAGRVQTCALALIVKREIERLNYVRSAYNSITATFSFGEARLHSINDTVVATSTDFDADGNYPSNTLLLTNALANKYLPLLTASKFTISELKSSPRRSKPPKPFITSSFQRECCSKLGFNVGDAMRGAQILYEQGYITYMRTDSDILSKDAFMLAQSTVQKKFGDEFLGSNTNRVSDGAHEPIRPAIWEGKFIDPLRLIEHSRKNGGQLSPKLVQMYELVYQRTIASVMADMVTNITSLSINSDDVNAQFRTSTSIVVDRGYSAIYQSSKEAQESKNFDELAIGDVLHAINVTTREHMTSPPSRFSEASFVKELERLGIGRPSTYAQVIHTLKARAYVQSSSKSSTDGGIVARRASGISENSKVPKHSLIPTLTSLTVCTLLSEQAPLYVNPEFTSEMEKKLDYIASNDGADRNLFLKRYHEELNQFVEQVMMAPDDSSRQARLPLLEGSNVEVLVGPWGPYVQRLQNNETQTIPLPETLAVNWTQITPSYLNALLDLKHNEQEALGIDPETGLPLYFKVARYGAYLQLGEKGEDEYKTQTLPSSFETYDVFESEEESVKMPISFDEALLYIRLPRTLGSYNESECVAGFGRYGPYIRYEKSFFSIPSNHCLLKIELEEAIEIIVNSAEKSKKNWNKGVLAELGRMEGDMIKVKSGRFGTYLNWRKVNAKIPTAFLDAPEAIPLSDAWSAIQEKVKILPKRSKSNKKNQSEIAKLPPAPKRPLSAYFHYSAEMRPLVKDKCKTIGETSKLLGQMWADEKDKSNWDDLAAKSKVNYKEDLKKWKDKCNELMGSSKSRASRVVAGSTKRKITSKNEGLIDLPDAPKKPLSAYFHYSAEMRPLVKGKCKTIGETSKLLGQMWADEKDKSKWDDLAAKSKVNYKEDLKKWKDKCNELMGSSKSRTGRVVAGSTKRKITSKNEGLIDLPDAPKKPLSAYFHYSAEMRPLVKGKCKTIGETSKLLGQMWADEKDKSKWDDLAAKSKVNYKENLKEWKDKCNELMGSPKAKSVA